MRRSERLLRAATAACLSTGVALAMHVAGGGRIPDAPGIVVPLVLAFTLSAQLSGTAMSRWRLATAVIAAQAFFHGFFALGTGARVVASGTGAHASHQPTSLTVDAVGTHAAHMALTPSMLAAHAVAAAATYAILRRADVFVALVRRAAASLVARLSLAVPRLVPRACVPDFPGRVPVAISVARCPHGMRGPPLRLA